MTIENNKILQYFEEISKIPRASGDMKNISSYLISFAKSKQLEYVVEECGNVIIRKYSITGNAKTISLQAHIDMVYVTKDNSINYQDGIKLVSNNEYISAINSSLGADDGIGVAYILCILDSEEFTNVNIEAIFTVDEEIGLLGASDLDPGNITGDYLINLDSEDEGVITVSCAGGNRTSINIEVNRINFNPTGYKKLDIKVSGLKGGHSGIDIDKNLANANYILCQIISKISKYNIEIVNICGGQFDNVICKEAYVSLYIEESKIDDCIYLIDKYYKELKEKYKNSDNGLDIKCSIIENKNPDMIYSNKENFLLLINNIINGIIEKENDTVITSLNLGIIKYEDNKLVFSYGVRSNIDLSKDKLVDKLQHIANLCGGKLKITGDYPAWPYDKDSILLQNAKDTYKELFNKEPIIESIHAGLECGIFVKKKENIEAISIGPTLIDVHSINERVKIDTISKCYNFLISLIKKL